MTPALIPSPTQRVSQPKARSWRARLQATLWRFHRLVGIGFALVVITVSATGSLLVLEPEIENWLEPERHRLPNAYPEGAARAPIGAVVQQLSHSAPREFRPLRLEPAASPSRADKYVFVSEDGQNRRWSAFVDPYTGTVIWSGDDQRLFGPWMLHLHEHLRIGDLGFVVTGAAALALVLLALSGLLITRRRTSVLVSGPTQTGKSTRKRWSQLHQWLGLVSLYFSLVLGGTGLWFAVLIVPDVLRSPPPEPLGPAFPLESLVAVEPAIERARAEFPGAELARVVFPWKDGVGLQIRFLHREAPVWEKTSRMDFDAETGAVKRITRAYDGTWDQKLSSILGPLHFGTQGAEWVRWTYAIGGFTPALLGISGLLVAWSRRRSPAPHRAVSEI